jgi:DNA-directed RNA polymerase specialized sigma24 family protein
MSNGPGPTQGQARLDEIPTRWSLLRLAHRETIASAGPARNALVLRYARAIRNFVGALVKDPHDADEVAQEVVHRLLRGQFAAASPERGSFRRMLAVAAHNQARTLWARKRRQEGVPTDFDQLADDPIGSALEEEGVSAWRQALLELAWRSLEEYERTHPGSVTYSVLRLRADFPDDESDQLAARLSEKTGRKFRPEAARQQLRRARVRFAQALLEEVARGLEGPTPERVEEELIDVGLMPYVQDFLPEDWRTRGELSDEV